ncbi:MAG: hypothetical protein R6U63_11905 [Longimicrobiales bacterium]
MRRVIQYMLAATSIITGFVAVRMGRQFDRSIQRAFALTADDVP